MNLIRRFLKFLLDTTAPRTYMEKDGILYIKERGKDWEPLMDHLKREHPEEYAKAKALEDGGAATNH